MAKVRTWLFALLFAVGIGGTFTAVALPSTSYADPACDKSFLTIPPWYKDLTTAAPDCNIKSPTDAPFNGNISQYVWKIVLNVTEILLHAIGYLTVGFIIYGGFKYLLSAGSADGITKAKTTIFNAVIGLVLSILSIAIVNLISGAL